MPNRSFLLLLLLMVLGWALAGTTLSIREIEEYIIGFITKCRVRDLIVTFFSPVSVQEPTRKTTYRLTKPFIGDDGKIYTCSERNLFAFESNGTIAWTLHLNYSCHVDIAPVSAGRGKVSVLKISPSNNGNSESTVEVFFGDTSTTGGSEEIVGISVNPLSWFMVINVKNRGLFAYTLRGKFLWSAGPVLYRFGYRQGCRKNATDCYFTSAPVIDQCEGSIYISNNWGELYSLSIRSPQFNWIQDFSAYDELLIITAGNNGRVYVTVPVQALVFALDVYTGNVLWQNDIGPLSTTDCSPVVDSNGWISIGSLDGFLYSFSPTGVSKKFPKVNDLDSVVQVSPFLDCSGYAMYISQTQMVGKITHTIGEHTYISSMKPINAVYTLLVPATGFVHWTRKFPGQFSTLLSDSDLHHFALDERILLGFIAANYTGSPFSCRTTSQKTASSCSQARVKHLSIYTGNERTILFFLLLQTLVLAVLAGLVRFCCIFWRKKKLQNQDLGKFLEKRHSLRVKKKEFDRTITELEQKAAKEAVGTEVLDELGDLVREREGIERKLLTTYSLGRDRTKPQTPSLLPLYEGSTKSYSFQGRKKESVTIFHTLSDTSSRERSTSDSGYSSNGSSHLQTEAESCSYYGDKESTAKTNAHAEAGPSSSAGMAE
ncbi:hypothetical protein AQUCO_02600166v1, partial [Aquilegia coerulea]